MGKTRRKEKTFVDVPWADAINYTSEALNSRDDRNKKKKASWRRRDDEPLDEDDYGSFQKMGKRK